MKFKTICLSALCVFFLSGTFSYAALQPTDYYKKIADAEVSIERLRKVKKVDWKVIGQKYDVCKAFIKDVDKEFKTTYTKDIPEALKQCAAGKDVKVNQQTLAKGLQHAVVLTIKQHLSLMATTKDAKERKQAALNVQALFEGIRPTFTRRDKDYFKGEKTLELHADTAIAELVETAETTNNFVRSVSRLKKVIDRTYSLCVLYELQAIEKLRKTDTASCAVKKAEAVIFYRIVEDRMKKNAPSAHKTLLSIINADYASVNAKAAEKALQEGLKKVKLI